MSINNFINGLQVRTAWSYLNLTVYPLVSPDKGKSSYLTLDEAMGAGRFRIGEVSMGGSVPELKVKNGLSQPVLLLDGEELIGAKQNRVLNLTIMVPANTEMTIPVSCVEAGRWQHTSDAFVAGDRTQFARGRAKKLAQVSHSLRESGARISDQSDVWSEIAAKSERMSVASPTGAMSAIYEQSRSRLDDCISAMPRIDHQVGAAFCIGGKIAGIDVFDSADTFAKTASKLIRSYAVDALESPSETVTNENAADAVRAFLNDIAIAEVFRLKAVGLGDDLRLNGPNLAGAGLEISGQVVHLVSFPGGLYEDHKEGQHLHARMARARMRRTFH